MCFKDFSTICNICQYFNINLIILQLETKAIVNVSVYCVLRVLFDPNLAKKSLFRGNEINTKMKSGNISISYVYLNEKLLIKIHLSSIRIIVLFFFQQIRRENNGIYNCNNLYVSNPRIHMCHQVSIQQNNVSSVVM